MYYEINVSRDTGSAQTTYPWYAANELRIDWCESNGAGFPGLM